MLKIFIVISNKRFVSYSNLKLWIGAFNEDEVKKLFKIPQNKKVVALLTVGIPAESPTARPRKSLEEIVAYEEYE